MNQPTAQFPAPSVPQKNADAIARVFNMAYGNTLGYGPLHPATQKSTVDLHAQLTTAFELVPTTTLMVDRESLYLDEWCVDGKLNARRFISLFRKAGLQSITFERGLTVHDVSTALNVLADYVTFPKVEMMSQGLAGAGVTRVRLNYVLYRRVTADEKVIDKNAGEPSGQPGASGTSSTPQDELKEMALDKLGSIFSLRNLAEKPAHLAGELLAIVKSGTPEAKQLVIGHIREINRQIRDAADPHALLSMDEMLESVFKLKMALSEGLAVQKEMGKLLREDGAIVSELDQLGYQTIVRLVREEYRGGTLSVKRLSQIIRRILPDPKELKRLLPLLKQGLVAEGMPLSEFLELVKEFTRELEGDGLVQILGTAADEMGLSVDDVLQGIKEDPAESARLIVLASEIRKATGSSQFDVSKLLSDYIEGISARLAMESSETAGREGGKALRSIIYRLEKQLLERLRSHGIAGDLLKNVEEQLSQRFQRTLNRLKTDWMVSVIAKGNDVSHAYLMQILDTIVDQEMDAEALRDPLKQVLSSRGFGAEQIQEFYTQWAAKLSAKKDVYPLPPGVLNEHNTLYFLQRQVRRFFRYQHPFSCFIVTVAYARFGDTVRPMTLMEAAPIMPDIYRLLVKMLRDLDVVGSLGVLDHLIPFVILPMTEEPGAMVVKKRLEAKIAGMTFRVGSQIVSAHPAISITPFDKEKTPDRDSLVAAAKANHEALLKSTTYP